MMHPAVLQTLAAEHVKDMVAMADKSRRARHARSVRRSRTSAAEPADLLPTSFRLERPSAQEPTATDPTAHPTSRRLTLGNLRNRLWPRAGRHQPAQSRAEAGRPTTRVGAVQ
jgi:hypothetical protein